MDELSLRDSSGTDSGFAAIVVIGDTRLQAAPVGSENPEMPQSPFLQGKLHCGSQHAQSVLHAAAEIYGRRLGKVFCRTGNFANPEAEVGALREHLIIKNKIIVDELACVEITQALKWERESELFPTSLCALEKGGR